MERPTHKRALLEESPLPLSDSNSIPLPDHQAKRIRLTLPPISSSFPPTNVSTSYPSYNKLPYHSSIHENNNFPILPPLSSSATDSTILPISSPRPILNQQELPSIDSLCSLPPLTNFNPQIASSVNPMSVSAILSN